MARSDWRRPSVEPVKEGYRRIKLVISYCGYAYHGWQTQDNASSVQSEIAAILSEIEGESVDVIGSGRTDAGVHALGQVAHFDTKRDIPAAKYSIILNTKLPKTIRILSSSEPEGLFHARFTTMAREYWYLVKEISNSTAFDEKEYMFLKKLPNLDTLNGYASKLYGTHDFTTFASSRDECPSKFRDIYVSKWDKTTDRFGLEVLRYRVCGNAFLYHQVRSMVGTMLECAEKGVSPEEFEFILESKDRSKAMKTALSDGLYLARISYDENEYLWFEEENGKG